MAEETIFSKIIRREIPSDIVYQDDLVTAFRDISPQAPTHILIIPNILIPTVNDVSAEHEQALGRMITVAAKIAEQEGVAEDGGQKSRGGRDEKGGPRRDKQADRHPLVHMAHKDGCDADAG